MADIMDFVRSAAANIGATEGETKEATGGILQALQGGAQGGDFDALLSAIPGAADLLPSGGSSGGGGLLGGAASMLSGGGGGGLGGALGALTAMSGSGLSTDKLSSLATLFMNFAKSEAGAELIGRLLDGAPALKKLLG